MLQIQEVPDRRKWEKEKSLCPRCDRLVTNQSYFSGSHIRAACRPAWRIQRQTVQWEIKNRRPRRADWRWEDPLDRLLKVPYGQGYLFEAPLARKTMPAEKNSNQLELAF